MRKLLIALTAVAAIGVALPAMSGAAQAEKVVIKTGHGHHHHHGWEHRHHHTTKVVIKRGHHHHHD